MITLSRLYQISVIVVLALALIMSSPGKEAKAWSGYARCPIAFSNALSHIRIAARGAGLDMQYCYVQGEGTGPEFTIIGEGRDGGDYESMALHIGHIGDIATGAAQSYLTAKRIKDQGTEGIVAGEEDEDAEV